MHTNHEVSNSYSIFKVMIVLFSVAVMTRAFPNYTGEQRNLVLLQDIASYLLLACGVVYVISVSMEKHHVLSGVSDSLCMHVSSFVHICRGCSFSNLYCWLRYAPELISSNSFNQMALTFFYDTKFFI